MISLGTQTRSDNFGSDVFRNYIMYIVFCHPFPSRARFRDKDR